MYIKKDTPLEQIDGLTKPMIAKLLTGNIKTIGEAVSSSEQDLAKLELTRSNIDILLRLAPDVVDEYPEGISASVIEMPMQITRKVTKFEFEVEQGDISNVIRPYVEKMLGTLPADATIEVLMYDPDRTSLAFGVEVIVPIS